MKNVVECRFVLLTSQLQSVLTAMTFGESDIKGTTVASECWALQMISVSQKQEWRIINCETIVVFATT